MANEDPNYTSWLREQPCAGCGLKPAGQVHHPRHAVAMGKRAHDHRGIPACYKCHEDVQRYRFREMTRDMLRTWLDLVAAVLRQRYERRSDHADSIPR